MKEIYKDIPNYEGYYQVSNLGNVKSLERKVKHSKSGFITVKEKIFSKVENSSGYYVVSLLKDSKRKSRTIHQLVAMAFLNHTPSGYEIVVDHINNNPLDNRLENLQLITSRENSSKDKKGGSSKYIGVRWHKSNKKWQSSIYINGKREYLGYFTNELEAHTAYQIRLKNI